MQHQPHPHLPASLDLTAAFNAFIDEYLHFASGQFHLCFESSTCLEGELTKLGIGEEGFSLFDLPAHEAEGAGCHQDICRL